MNRSLVLIHGFTGHAASWDELVAQLPSHECIRLVIRGHADVPAGAVGDCFEDEVRRLRDLIPPSEVPPVLCGYSLGARLALGLATAYPKDFGGLVLVGVHPGLPEPERAARRASDELWAQVLEREGLASFLARWSAQPLFQTQCVLPEEVRERQATIRRGHRPEGLAWALRSLGLGTMPSMWELAAELPLPIEIVAGAEDPKFAALAVQLGLRTKTSATLVEGAGHNVLLERPEVLARILRRLGSASQQ